ncbi:MAG TPA: glutamate--tRNA ligase, partial [Candidatus Altiarchaeales archaeon]|nr:glutamate--tRNA ligase [Candidatus Altiarchaeales archaeon]
DLYYGYAEKLIKQGNAYVCSCSHEQFKPLKDAGKPCLHRSASVGENMELWEKMIAGEFGEKDAVLRIKTDLENPDPALRDWVGFRIVKDEHPKVGGKYCVWPMLDFESAIEDRLQEITHIIRGKDLMDSGRRQKYIYDYLGWEYPEVLLWGRISIHEYGKFSSSGMAKMVAAGEVSGWDDPKLPTIRAFRHRGILPESITEFMLELGLSTNDVGVSMETLYAINRKHLDDRANRHFFIEDPLELVVTGAVEKTVEKPLHPSHKERGSRTFHVKASECCSKIWIPKRDADKLNVGDEFRLMNLYNVILESVKPFVGKMNDVKNFKVPKIEWLSEKIPAQILKHDGPVQGICEPDCAKIEVGEIIQFERYGFARLDEKQDGKLVFVYTHD